MICLLVVIETVNKIINFKVNCMCDENRNFSSSRRALSFVCGAFSVWYHYHRIFIFHFLCTADMCETAKVAL